MSFRIPQDWLDSIIYLYPDIPSAEAGDETGGTGFLLGWPMGGNASCFTLWAVTNRHVIEQNHWTIRVNKKGGGFEFIDTDDRQWLFHPDSDLAVRPIQLSQDIHKFSFLTKDWLLSKEWCDALDIGPGDDCIFVGRFVGHAGKKSNNPVARFGQIAQSPIEPVRVDGRNQECFLVEARSIGGSSGSPVFVDLVTAHYRPTINLKTAPDGSTLGKGYWPDKRWLLGVNYAMIPLWEKVCDSSGVQLQSGYRTPMNTGLMAVVPAWHLIDMLEDGDAGKVREALEKAIAIELAKQNKLPVTMPTQEPGQA